MKEKTLAAGGFLDEFEKDEVLRGVDLIALFRSFGVKLIRKGTSYMGRCPWHDDASPSLSVSAEKKLYNCFGCGESGDAVTLVRKMKGLTFREALEYLKVAPCPYAPDEILEGNLEQGELHYIRTADEPPAASPVLLDDIAAHYARKLAESEEARAYLVKRGFTDFGLLARFGVGYADGSLMGIIGESQKAELVALGVLNENKKNNRTWEQFSGCVVFPVFDDAGATVGMYGRAIDETSKLSTGGRRLDGQQDVAKTVKFPHRYLKGAHRGVFNRKASRVYDEIILTESIIDALSLIALGMENTQALYGVNGFTDEHVRLLKDDRVKRVILALDNDDAGRAASATLAERLTVEGFAVKIVEPISAKDWNEYLCNGGTADDVKALITASPVTDPRSAKTEHGITLKRDGIYYTAASETVQYRITGAKEIFVGSLRVAIKATLSQASVTQVSQTQASPATDHRITDTRSFVDTLELYSSKARATFALNFSKTCGMATGGTATSDIEPKIIEKDLLAILEAFEALRDKRLFGDTDAEENEPLTEAQREQGMALLKDPALFARIVADMDSLGYVGEDVNKKLLYLAASSRILDDPISVIILSQSAAGKSFLVDTVKKLMPPRDVIAVTSLSDQALNYVDDLMHKFLILGEAVHSDSVEHQIREMLSGKELSRLVAVKDEKTGVMKSAVVRRPVIVSAVMSGTNYGINPENASRCFVISADESREQTRRIHAKQREKYTLERYVRKESEHPEIVSAHHAAQRLLRNVKVVNPFAHLLNFPDSLMRTRRDHDRFMDLIACVCFLRQYQKEAKAENGIEYIECDIEDYRIAYEIMTEGVLTTTMRDFPKGTIEFYEMVRTYAREKSKGAKLSPHETSFTQREIREHSGYSQTWVKEQVRLLVDYEYLAVLKGGTARHKGVYRLMADRNIEELNLSMIPTPEEVGKLLKSN